jgi:hypothetical protein
LRILRAVSGAGGSDRESAQGGAGACGFSRGASGAGQVPGSCASEGRTDVAQTRPAR